MATGHKTNGYLARNGHRPMDRAVREPIAGARKWSIELVAVRSAKEGCPPPTTLYRGFAGLCHAPCGEPVRLIGVDIALGRHAEYSFRCLTCFATSYLSTFTLGRIERRWDEDVKWLGDSFAFGDAYGFELVIAPNGAPGR